jgi:hypothetical protein
MDLNGVSWRKSSYSGNNGDCVEVGTGSVGVLGVRDSKDPGGPVLVVTTEAWQVLTDRVKASAFAGF